MQLLYLLFYDQSNVQIVYATQTPYQAYPGNPQMQVAIPNPEVALVPLPLCDECSINAVKPGEDTCLGCLGESEPEWEWNDWVFGITPVPVNTWPPIVLLPGDSFQLTYNASSHTWTNSTSSSVSISSMADIGTLTLSMFKNKDSP